ncbi:MAG TPA: hypothetical protein VHF88_07670 [Thermoleophilaceae bacterium]|nr:hypothetical protein [Thermoleophilaceae bacterium]
MPTGKVGPAPDVPPCDRCGREAAFRDAAGEPVCEFCPAVDYGIDWGRSSAYTELAVAILSACAAVGATPIRRLHELVDYAATAKAVELPLAPPDSGGLEVMAHGPWLEGLTPITGRGEAIVATRRGAAQ